LLQGRYGAKVVEGEPYLLAVTRYIHLNPVKVRAAREWPGAERKRRLNAYRWSSYPGYVSERYEKPWISYEVLEHYGRNKVAARRRYRGYTEVLVEDSDEDLARAFEASRYAIGDADFIARTERELAGRAADGVRSRDIDLPRARMDLERIDREVARWYGVEAGDLRRHGIVAGPCKVVAMELAVRLSGLTQREIGAHYGDISGQAVAMARKKLREGDASALRTAEELVNLLSRP
jgi:hypothetical protein